MGHDTCSRRRPRLHLILAGMCAVQVLASLLGSTAVAQVQIVPTIASVAGTGTAGFSGDSGQALAAKLNAPTGAVFDGLGNLYFSDTANQRIRKITTAGVISTVAGTGTAGFNGDGLATGAQLNKPEGLAVDQSGNVYIADSLNERVRELVVSTGHLVTVAGNGTAGFSGDGASATQAELNLPVSLAIDPSGNLYVSDSNNNRVRIVTAGVISTFAGSGAAGPGTGSFTGDGNFATNATFSNPGAILIDSFNELLIWDAGNYRLRAVSFIVGDIPENLVSEVSGTGTPVAGGDGGPYGSAGFVNVTGLAGTPSTLYLVDSGANEVRAVNYGSGNISTVAGTLIPGSSGDGGFASAALLSSPTGVALDSSGDPYVTDSGNNRIREIAAPTSLSFPSTNLGSTSASTTFYLSATTSETISSITVPPSAGGLQEFSVGTITGCAVNGTTTNVAGTICQVPITFKPGYPGLREVPLVVVTANGTFDIGLSGIGVGPLAALTPGGTTTLAGLGTLTEPGALTFGPACAVEDYAGNIFICNNVYSYIERVDAVTGTVTNIAGDGESYQGESGPAAGYPIGTPASLVLDSAHNLYICDDLNYVVYRIDQATGLLSVIAGEPPATTAPNFGDGGPAYHASFSNPQQLALSPAGKLYIADEDDQLVRMIDTATGIISTVAGVNRGNGTAGTGQNGLATSTPLGLVVGVAVDPSENLYISDSSNNVIWKVDATTGLIKTIAGTGTAGFSGDGGPALSAQISNPGQLALDAAGDLYVADTGNLRIRRIDAATGDISTVMGSGYVYTGGDPYPQATNTTPGSATAINLYGPTSVSARGTGNLLVTDNGGNVFQSNVSAAVLSYPTIELPGAYDTTDSPQSFSVANIGNAALTLSTPASGNNPALPGNVALDVSSTCPELSTSSAPLILAPGANCGKYGADLTELGVGTNTSTVTLQDNSLSTAAVQTVSLVGTVASAGSTVTTLSLTWVPNGIDETVYDFNPETDVATVRLDYGSIATFTATVTHQAAGATQAIAGTVSFYVNGTLLNGGSNISLQNGTATFTTTNLPVGNDTFTATFTPGTGFTGSTTAQGTYEDVYPATPAISYTKVEVPYDGQPHAAVFTVGRPNLNYTLLYGGQIKSLLTVSPPTQADIYNLYVTFTDPNYGVEETLTNAVTIDFLHGAVSLSNLLATYDGNPHAVTVTTTPANEPTIVAYSDSTDEPPSAAGAYPVFGGIDETKSNYSGSANGTLVISSGINSVWITNQDSTVSHLNTSGELLTTVGTPSGTSTLGSVAIDDAGDAWSVANGVNALTEVSPSGSLVGTYNGGGLTAPTSVAVDGNSQIWVADTNNAISVFSNSGAPLSSSTGYQASALNAPSAIAIDQSGSVWIANAGGTTVTRLIGAAAPVVTSTVSGVTQSTPGSRP